jgi:dTDP-4-dehydrorhamnose reductase
MGAQTLLLTGAGGFVGGHILHQALDKYEVVALGRNPAPFQHPRLKWYLTDVCDHKQVTSIFHVHKPELVVHAAADSDIDRCEMNPQDALRINVDATEHLARLCRGNGSKMIFTSTDAVFDGHKSFYREEDVPMPVNHYGKTKIIAEQIVQQTCPGSVVTRLAWVLGFSLSGRGNSFINKTVSTLQNGQEVNFPDDEFRTPIHVSIVAQALLRLAAPEFSDIYHLAGNDRSSRYELACRVAARAQVDGNLVIIKNAAELAGRAKRAKDVSLDNRKARHALQMDFLSIDEALNDIFSSEHLQV